MIKETIISRQGGRTARFQVFSKQFADAADELMKRMADEYRLQLVLNITSQKFAGSYAPLSDFWEKWKAEHGKSPDFWICFGYLYQSLSVRKTPKGYSVGVETGVYPSQSSSILKKSNSKTPVWKYLFYNEYGRSAFSKNGLNVKAQPARPVFGPTRAEMGEMYWTAKMKKDFQKKVSQGWSQL